MRLSTLLAPAPGGLVPVAMPPGDPTVSAVVTTDLLDPSRYLSGGELVLTGLAWWRAHRPARSREFVAALVGAGVAALAAGEAHLGRVPDDLVAACVAAGLPLLRVPVDVSFAGLTELATRHVSTQRSSELATVIGRHRELMAAASAGRPGGLARVLDLLATDLDLSCSVLTATGRLVAAPAGAGPSEPEGWALAERYLRAPSLPCLVRPASGRPVSLFGTGAGRTTSWLLAVAEDHRGWDPDRRAVLDELAALVALDQGVVSRRPEADQRLAELLARAGPAVEVVGALRQAGLDPDAPTLAVLAIGAEAGPVLAECLAAIVAPWCLGPVGGEAVAVVPGGDPGVLVERVRASLARLAAADCPVRVGVSDAVTGGDGLLGAVAAARAVAAAVGPGAVAGPELLSSHALLLAGVPAPLRTAYRERVLGAVLEHDRLHRTDLIRTLTAYLECSGSWSRCARRMHLHVNTLRYRIQRIEALTGRDLRQLADQSDLLLALHLPP